MSTQACYANVYKEMRSSVLKLSQQKYQLKERCHHTNHLLQQEKSFERSREVIISMMGGEVPLEPQKSRLNKINFLITSVLLAGAHQVYVHRQNIPSKVDIQAYIIKKMTKVEEKGDMAVIHFIVLLAITELVGLSTAILEPVGGMLFGVKKGFMANGIGKILGAMIAFSLGRTLFVAKVKSKLLSQQVEAKDGGQHILKLLEASIEKKPFMHSLMMRFSIFPEFIVNFGLSALEPVKWHIFLLASSIQILPYTLLWACVGHDSALRLKDSSIPINNILTATFGAVTMFYCFGVPLITAAWTHSLMKEM